MVTLAEKHGLKQEKQINLQIEISHGGKAMLVDSTIFCVCVLGTKKVIKVDEIARRHASLALLY